MAILPDDIGSQHGRVRTSRPARAVIGPGILVISHPSSLKNAPNSQDCVFETRCVVCAAMTSFHSQEYSGALSREGRERMGCYVLGFQEIDQTQVAVAGGKGAHLGELSRIEGIRVPAGFCVTTDAFQRIMAEAPSIDDRLDRLSRLPPDDREAIRALSAQIRRTLEGIAIPDDLAAAITPQGFAAASSALLSRRRFLQADLPGPAPLHPE